MKVAIIIAGAIAGLIAIVFVVGALLPQKHVARREILLSRSPGEVYAVVRDFASAPAGRSELKRVVLLEPVAEKLRFREEFQYGAMTYEVMEDRQPERLVTRIVDRDLGYFGTWTYEFVPAENGATRVRITEDGEVPSIVFRFMSRFIFGHTRTMETYLRALGRKLGEEVTPK
ncbi:MAG TPA: SRPBCC family protein [Chthoniobacterales bacterium]